MNERDPSGPSIMQLCTLRPARSHVTRTPLSAPSQSGEPPVTLCQPTQSCALTVPPQLNELRCPSIEATSPSPSAFRLFVTLSLLEDCKPTFQKRWEALNICSLFASSRNVTWHIAKVRDIYFLAIAGLQFRYISSERKKTKKSFYLVLLF